MSECHHFEGQTRGGRKLTHTDQTERQIELGLHLEPEKLVTWIKAPSTAGSLVEEAMVFLLLHYRALADSLLVEELAAALDQRMRTRAIECYGNIVRTHSGRELCADIVSLAWIILLEAPTGRGVWLQICFRRFIHNLARDVLRGMRLDATTSDLNSGDVLVLMDQSASPEDLVYAREVLSQLKPHQRQAFIMQRGFREPQRAIAKAFGRSDRLVRIWLKQAQLRLNQNV